MHMIGHQAIPLYAKPVPLALGMQEFQVDAFIVINEKHVLFIVPPLRHMVGYLGNYYAR